MGKKKKRTKLKAVKEVKNIKVKMKKKKKLALKNKPKQPTAQNKPKRNDKGQLLPGEKLNPKGRGKGNFSLTKILREILMESKGRGKKTQGEELMRILVKEARGGNSKLLHLVIERLDGKVPDRVISTDTGPLSEIEEEKLNEIINAGKSEPDEPTPE